MSYMSPYFRIAELRFVPSFFHDTLFTCIPQFIDCSLKYPALHLPRQMLLNVLVVNTRKVDIVQPLIRPNTSKIPFLDNKHAGSSGPAYSPVGCIPDTPRIAKIHPSLLSPTEIVCMIMANRKNLYVCLLYTSPSPRDRTRSRMPSSA